MLVKQNISPKIIDWAKLITTTSTAQVLIQAVGFATGILIIRILPIHEYAFYTLANTILGTMNLLADGGGISTGVMAEGGKVWQDKKRLGEVLYTGLNLRRKFAIATLLITTPFSIYLLRHHDASWLMSILLTLSIIPSFYISLSSNLLEIISKLQQDIVSIQRIQVITNLSRLFSVGILTFIFPFAFITFFVTGFPQIWQNIKLRELTSTYTDKTNEINQKVKIKIIKIVKRTMPAAIYYSLSSQLTLWLVTIVGTTSGIAQIGALSRLGMVLIIFTNIFNIIITPRFARIPDNPKIIINRFLFPLIVLTILCLAVIFLVYTFPKYILWVIGSDYSGLAKELLLYIIGSSIVLINISAISLETSRGWIINPLLSIPLNIISIIIGILLFGTSSLIAILNFNIFISFIQMIMNVSYGIFKIKTVNTKLQ